MRTSERSQGRRDGGPSFDRPGSRSTHGSIEHVGPFLHALDLPLALLRPDGEILVAHPLALALLGLSESHPTISECGEHAPWVRCPQRGEDLRLLEWIRRASADPPSGWVELPLRTSTTPLPRLLRVRIQRARGLEILGSDLPDDALLLLLQDQTEQELTRTRLLEFETRRLLRDSISADVGAGMAIDQVLEHAVLRLHAEVPDVRVSYAGVDERAHMAVHHSQGPESLAQLCELAIDLTRVPDYFEALMTRDALVYGPEESPEPTPELSLRGASRVDVPLRHSETLRGVLCFDAEGPRTWSDHEVACLRTAADGLTVALGDAHRQQERIREREQRRHDARHDRLTGLPNRPQLLARIEQSIRRRSQHPGQGFALLFLDLDHFQVVNEGLGHDAGDQLLRSLAERLRAFSDDLGQSEGRVSLLPARLGGDEFVLLLDGIREPAEAERLAESLQEWLARPHLVGGSEVSATASIGIVVDNGDYASPEQLLRDADSAMYGAKRSGKARHVLFDDHMHSAAIARLRLERDLRRAVERGEFVAHYQPVVDLQKLRLAGFESLMRWEHPETGLVPPNEFIPLAEELGLIEPMGEWILRESARQLVAWERELGAGGLVMHVNVSRRQLLRSDLPETVAGILEATGITPSALKLEVTENAVMAAPQELSAVLRRLRDLGVHLCMDDFGTGQSSLAALISFPIDVLKVDRSFVRNIDGRQEYAAITEAIVTLAHSLGMAVVAEGVEKRAELEIIRELQCDQAQGFLLSRPLPQAAAQELLQRCLANGGHLSLPDDE